MSAFTYPVFLEWLHFAKFLKSYPAQLNELRASLRWNFSAYLAKAKRMAILSLDFSTIKETTRRTVYLQSFKHGRVFLLIVIVLKWFIKAHCRHQWPLLLYFILSEPPRPTRSSRYYHLFYVFVDNNVPCIFCTLV